MAIDSMHKEFNADTMEAVAKVPAPSEEMKGKVIDELEKAYQLNDKLIRPAKVVVGE
jgi:molecular chaperone GrpE